MKKFYIILLTIISSFSLRGQNLSIKEIISIQKQNVEHVNDLLSNKKWEFNSSRTNNSVMFQGFTLVSWSFKKDKWENSAEAWLFLFQMSGMSNAIRLSTNQEYYNKLKSSILKEGFKLTDTKINNDGIETYYRNSQLEIICSTTRSIANEEYSYSSSTEYSVTIYNYKEIDALKKEHEEKEKKIIEEEKRIETERIKQDQLFQEYLNKGDSALLKRSYINAIEFYKKAELVKSDEEKPQKQIAHINQILEFLKVKDQTIYEYKLLKSDDYNKIYSTIFSILKTEITKNSITGNLMMSIVFTIDTNGKTISKLNFHNNIDADVQNKISTLLNTIKLEKVSVYDYPVNAKAEYNFEISANDFEYKLKKNNVSTVFLKDSETQYQSEISNYLTNTPIGRYTVLKQKRSINLTDFSTNKVIKYRGIGGPSNMFLSVLVPGLGVRNVTGGVKNGLSRTICSYGFIIAGIGCKLWSDNEYQKYHSANTIESIDKHYANADFMNKSFFVLTATGAAIWLYDIIWVANKGFKNLKEQRKYKNSLSFKYNPLYKSLAFSYSIKF